MAACPKKRLALATKRVTIGAIQLGAELNQRIAGFVLQEGSISRNGGRLEHEIVATVL
jgi:hypothetical protein